MSRNLKRMKKFFISTVKTQTPPIPPLGERAGGWGDLYDSGNRIRGGEGGITEYYSDWLDLYDDIRNNDANDLVKTYVYTGGNLTVSNGSRTLTGKSNKTIIHDSGQQISGLSLVLFDCENIVIRNIKSLGPYGVNSYVSGSRLDHFTCNGSKGIWFDHLTLDGQNRFFGNSNDYSDALIDIGNSTTRNSDYIVISNSVLKGNDKAILIVYDQNEDFRNAYRTTIRNCVFENIVQRSPMVRYSQVHLLDILYRWTPDWETYSFEAEFAYWVRPSVDSQIYAQRCYFENGKRLQNTSETTGGLKFDNCFIGTFDDAGSATEFNPENVEWNPNTLEGYTYPVLLSSPEQAKEYALQNAGANLIIEPIV